MWLQIKGHMLGMAGLAGPGPCPGRGRLIPPPLWGRTPGRPRGKPGRRPGKGWPGSRRPGLSPSMLPVSSFIFVSLSLMFVQSSDRLGHWGTGGCLLPGSPGSGLDSRLGLQTPQTERDKWETAGRGRVDWAWLGLTCKQQLAPDTRASAAEYLLQITVCEGRIDQSLGFSCSVLEISLCMLHRWPGLGHEGVRYLASTGSLSEQYPRVLETSELQICNKWCLVAWEAALTMVLSRRAGWEQLKCAGQQNIVWPSVCLSLSL